MNAPLLKKENTLVAKIVGTLFLSIFLIAGLAMVYPLSIRPIVETIHAHSWVKTPCHIMSASVVTHDDSDGDTYSIAMTYRYRYNDTVYTSDIYDPVSMSSSGYASKKRKVQRYLQAGDTICYVNPQNPSEAVIIRGFRPVLLFTLFPIPFILVGFFGIKATLFTKAKPRRRSSFTSELRNENAVCADEYCELKPTKNRFYGFIALLFATLFWNGIISVFIVALVQEETPEIFPILFLIPFVLIGLALFVGMVHKGLSLMNPVPVIQFDHYPLRLGEIASCTVRMEGAYSRISRMKITCTGKESATYRRGTDTYTDTSLFFHEVVAETTSRNDIREQYIELPIPASAMHSFSGSSNKIIWELEILCDISLWPNSTDVFELTVVPHFERGVA